MTASSNRGLERPPPWQDWVEASKNCLKTWQTLSLAVQNWAKDTGAGNDPDPFAALNLIEQMREAGCSAQIGVERLNAVEAWAKGERQNQLANFDRLIREFCTTNGLSLAGRFPRYVVNKYWPVHLNVEKDECLVGPERLRTLFPIKIFQLLKSEVAEEGVRTASPSNMLSLLEHAYRRALAIRGQSYGSPAPVRELLRELVVLKQTDRFWRSPVRQHFSEYSEEHFARDISSLVERGLLISENGARLELLPTAFPKDGIRIYQGEGERIVGNIAFQKVAL